MSASASTPAKDMAAPLLVIPVAQWNTQPYATIDNKICMTATDPSDPSACNIISIAYPAASPTALAVQRDIHTTGAVADGTYTYQYRIRDTSAQNNQSVILNHIERDCLAVSRVSHLHAQPACGPAG